MIDTYEKFLVWVIIVLIIQSFLCFKVKSRIIRLLPIILCLLLVIAFVIRIAITPPGWERFGCLLMIMQAIYTMAICGITWVIWAVAKHKRKKQS